MNQSDNQLYLPPGITLNNRYRIGSVLGMGGFGVVYEAQDTNLNVRVAVKEFLPKDIAGRTRDQLNLVPHTQNNRDDLLIGIERFIEEARVLAKFQDHSGIVKVSESFKANNTAYMVMQFLDGMTLKDYLKRQPGERISFDVAVNTSRSPSSMAAVRYSSASSIAGHRQGCSIVSQKMAGRKWGDTMNTLTINGYNAVVAYDEEIDMFRGEFVGLNGGADFYASDIAGLRKEGEISLRVFLDACQERGIEPRKHYSGKFNLRVPPDLHERLATQAAAHGKSINAWVLDVLKDQATVHA